MLRASDMSLFIVVSLFVFSMIFMLFLFFQDNKDMGKALKRALLTSVLTIFSIYWFFFKE